MDAGDAEGALSHYMKDMPPEWLADAKASSEWGEIAAGVVSLRADGQSLAWAVAALEDGALGGIRKPVLAMYGTETFPEMPARRRASSKPSPAPSESRARRGAHLAARADGGRALHLRQVLPATIPSAGGHTGPSLQHRALAGRFPVVYLGLCQWGITPGRPLAPR